MDIQSRLNKQSKKINRALEAYLPPQADLPSPLGGALRYAVLGGGKRVRPIFTLEACLAVGGDEGTVMPAACAIEFIHNYSLVHDDMPCMDDDRERRGLPTCHVKYGEDMALLVGDALLTLAFKVLTTVNGKGSAETLRRQLSAAHMVAEAAGLHGMVGGQAVDMVYQKKEKDLPTIEFINTHKTGALIAASVRTGAYLGGGSAAQVEALYRYGKYTGLLFQIVDDILDGEGYAKLVGMAEAKKHAAALLLKAKKELSSFGKRADTLKALADFVYTRKI